MSSFLFSNLILTTEEMLRIAAGNGDLLVVRYILQNIPLDINAKDEEGHNALFYATRWNYLNIVKELLHRNADINIQDNDLRTPLMYAANLGYLEIADELLNHPNINLYLKDKNDKTALEIAKDSYSHIIALLIIDNENFDIDKFLSIIPKNKQREFIDYINLLQTIIAEAELEEITRKYKKPIFDILEERKLGIIKPKYYTSFEKL